MQKILLPVYVLLASLAARTQPASDSLKLFLENVFSTIQQNSVYHSVFDWKTLHATVFSGIDTAHTKNDLIPAIRTIYRSLNDKHGAVILDGKRIGMNEKPTFTIRQVLKDQFKTGIPKIRTRFFDGGYGYILIPGISFDPAKTGVQAQEIQDSLCQLEPQQLKGLIIDLRLNGGGNMHPMITGLHQVIGDGPVGSFCDLNGKPFRLWRIKDNAFYIDSMKMLTVMDRCSIPGSLKVVVLLSQITASSGEILAITLKGRPQTLYIGEKSAGYATSNAGPFYIDGQQVFVMSSLIADRNGNIYTEGLSPDIQIVEGDDFTDLAADAKVSAALHWLRGK